MQMKRLESLDALRGFDMIWIIGLEQAMRGFCVLFPGGQDWWFKRQFHHVPWDGLAFYDTIFPLFIFIAGVSFPFSYAKQTERGLTPLKVHLNIFRRCALLVLLGMVYNGVLAFARNELSADERSAFNGGIREHDSFPCVFSGSLYDSIQDRRRKFE